MILSNTCVVSHKLFEILIVTVFVLFVGQTVRRDNCALVKDVVETCLQKILIERSVQSAIECVSLYLKFVVVTYTVCLRLIYSDDCFSFFAATQNT
jgi:DNA polymerase elongation subunit (family B)